MPDVCRCLGARHWRGKFPCDTFDVHFSAGSWKRMKKVAKKTKKHANFDIPEYNNLPGMIN